MMLKTSLCGMAILLAASTAYQLTLYASCNDGCFRLNYWNDDEGDWHCETLICITNAKTSNYTGICPAYVSSTFNCSHVHEVSVSETEGVRCCSAAGQRAQNSPTAEVMPETGKVKSLETQCQGS